MENPRFTQINEAFVCSYCAKEVPPLRAGCRNHCPYCLSSMHLDINPGDRASTCGGQQKAISYELHGRKGIVLIFRCLRCKVVTRNKSAVEDALAADSYEQILALTPACP